MTDQALKWSEGTPDLDVSQWFDDLIEYWKTQRSGELEKAVEIAQRSGWTFQVGGSTRSE